MQKYYLWLVLGIAVAVGGVAGRAFAADETASMKQGDDAWLGRSASDARVTEAIAAYEQAAAGATAAEAWYKIARAYYFLGRFAPAAQKKDLFAKGIDAGKKALAADAGSAGAHYWYAACLAKSVETASVMTKLKYKGEMESHLKRARQLDAPFYFGGPDRLIGMILYKSPVASNSEAIEHLRASLSFGPDYSLTLVSLAEVLIAEKQYAEARQMCTKVQSLKPMPGFEKELADDQALARKLLASMPQ